MKTTPLNAAVLAFPLITAVPALAQETGQTLPTDTAIPSLMFFTFAAVIAVLVVALVMFLRRRSNREATERGLGISDKPLNAPPDKKRT